MKRKQEGFALVSVIWIAGLLAIVSTAFVLQVKSNTLLTRNLVYGGKAEKLADGIANLLAFRLSYASDVAALKPNGEQSFCEWGGTARIGYRIQDQAGLIDLNTGDTALMRAILKGLGMTEQQSNQLLNELRDFRDPDSLTGQGGPEPVSYTGQNYGPKNAPFETVSELDQVPGITNELLFKLQEFTTIYSQSQGYDPSSAPALLKVLLQSGGQTQADEIRYGISTPSPSTTFAIDVVVETMEGSRFYRHAVISILRQPERPFATLEWERGRDSSDWTIPKLGLEPCVN